MAFNLDCSAPAPRVNFALMSHYVGQKVTLVGKVEHIEGNICKVKAADEGMVDVILNGVAPTDSYVEVIGTVESPGSIREESSTGFGNNFGTLLDLISKPHRSQLPFAIMVSSD